MGCWADGTGRKNEGHERRNLFGFAPSARPGRRTLRAGVWFREWQVWLPALGSAPPPLGAPPRRKAHTRFHAAPVPALSHPRTLSHAGETEARRYASSCTRRLPVGRAWTPRKPSETGWSWAGPVPCPSSHHGEEQANVEGSPRRRLSVLHRAHPGDVTSEGVTWHRRV